MNTIYINQDYASFERTYDIPETGRGRALHTVDWFLNGSARLAFHDSLQVTIQDCADSQYRGIS